MSNFIKIEPSTDMHLVKDPAFKASGGALLNTLSIKIWEATDTVINGTSAYHYTDITSSCAFDFYPIGQTVVSRAGDVLTPLNKGVAFMQVRLHDVNGTDYHYLVVRITVHDKFDGWWFGNDSFTLFQDANFAHGQPSVYASFDGGDVGDITGHEYVTLRSNSPALIEIAANAALPYRGRIRGISEGPGSITGSLMGRDDVLNIQVKDFVIANNKIVDRVRVDETTKPKYKHNILFIGEGFSDSAKFTEALTKINEKLFDTERHQPYKMLKENFNVWSVFNASAQEGITQAARLNDYGTALPLFDDETLLEDEIADASAPGGKKQVYSIRGLTQIVGLPDKSLTERGLTNENFTTKIPAIIAEVKAAWKIDPTAIKLGYIEAKVPTDYVIYLWLMQAPLNLIPQATDSYYGFIAGNRQGERVFMRQPIANEITGSSPQKDFIQRIREWNESNKNNVDFTPTVDPRRWSPDIYHYEDSIGSKWVAYFFQKHIIQFDEKTNPAIEPAFLLGQIWNGGFAITPGAKPEVKSAGLVCFLVNSVMAGRSANFTGFFIGAIAGDMYGSFFQANKDFANIYSLVNNASTFDVLDDATKGIRKLTIRQVTNIDFKKLVSMLAHELGHSFKLGDEYEAKPGAAPLPPDPSRINLFDNLVHFDDITGAATANFPKPIDPDKIKWGALHRVKLSVCTTENATVASATTVVLKFNITDLEKMRTMKNSGEKVFLRKLGIHFPSLEFKQLRQTANDVNTKDIFTNLVISNIDETNFLVTLAMAAGSVPANFSMAGPEDNIIPAGSIIYLPFKGSDGVIRTLIEAPVLNFMKNNKYNSNVPAGRALTENNKDGTANWDPIQRTSDAPPSIDNFKGPCEDHNLIGVYEGGGTFVGDTYRPAGACKMRNEDLSDEESQFCFVCKYLIVSRVNGSKLDELDRQYPQSKSDKWDRFLSGIGGVNLDGLI